VSTRQNPTWGPVGHEISQVATVGALYGKSAEKSDRTRGDGFVQAPAATTTSSVASPIANPAKTPQSVISQPSRRPALNISPIT
jgi:hypothetical protein